MSGKANAPSPWLLLDTNEIRAEAGRLDTQSARAVGAVWLLLVGAIMFSAVNVALFAIHHGVPRQTAWALDLLFAVGLVIIIQADSILARHGRHGGGWVATARVYCGLATLVLNIWAPVAAADPAGVLTHIVAPLLLVLFAEAVPRIRRHYAALIKELLTELRRREQAERATVTQTEDQQRAERRRAADAAEQERRHAAELQAEERRRQLAIEEQRLAVQAAEIAAAADRDRQAAETERARFAAAAAARQAEAEAARLAALGRGRKSTPKSTPKSTQKSIPKSTPPGPVGGAGDPLMESARRFWTAHLASEGQPPSQRRLKAALGVGFERAGQIQRALAAESFPDAPAQAEAGGGA